MSVSKRLPMRPRLAATLAMVPVTVFLWWVTYYEVLESTWPAMFGGATPPTPIWAVFANAVILYPGPFWLYFLVVLIIWWRTVRWTARRRAGVLAVTGVVVGCSFACGYFALEGSYSDRFLQYSALTLNFVLGPAALVAVSWICYPAASEMGDGTLRCPECGYDVRGQRECRCPECGREFSIGDLIPEPDQ